MPLVVQKYYLVDFKLLLWPSDEMFVERQVSYSRCYQKMKPFKGQSSWAQMISPEGKLTALACHPTKKVNKAE
jgi:hypothetical protein